tara:strand:+ start:79 stop:363 length:285 start_codon:yes stop_codon:yes gene_type:complete
MTGHWRDVIKLADIADKIRVAHNPHRRKSRNDNNIEAIKNKLDELYGELAEYEGQNELDTSLPMEILEKFSLLSHVEMELQEVSNALETGQTGD